MARIRRHDIVTVIAGRDRGKNGKVIAVFPARQRALVEGVNLIKRHTRRRREDEQGGIIAKEATIHLANLALSCPKCQRPVRIRWQRTGKQGRARLCHRCGEVLAEASGR